MIGNEIADLTKQREPMLRWLLFLAFCFHNRALWHGAKQKPTLFLPKTPSAYGMAVLRTYLFCAANLRVNSRAKHAFQRFPPSAADCYRTSIRLDSHSLRNGRCFARGARLDGESSTRRDGSHSQVEHIIGFGECPILGSAVREFHPGR